MPIIIDAYMNSVSPLPPISIAPIWTASAWDDSDVIKRFSFFLNFYFFSAFYSSLTSQSVKSTECVI